MVLKSNVGMAAELPKNLPKAIAKKNTAEKTLKKKTQNVANVSLVANKKATKTVTAQVAPKTDLPVTGELNPPMMTPPSLELVSATLPP